MPAGLVPPLTTTSKPEAMSAFCRVSMATVIFSLPYFSAAAVTSSGSATAAEFIDTLLTPISSRAWISSRLPMPPPTVSGTLMASTVRFAASMKVLRPSSVAVMSRKTSSSAPASL